MSAFVGAARRTQRLAGPLIAISAIGALAPQTLAPAASIAQGPSTAHAVGYYDTELQRVVLVGGEGQARENVRDRVWSWSGRRWELVTDSGPSARGNASAAYDARRHVAVITGGARRSARDSSTFEILAETWEAARNGWQRSGGTDIDPRDHQSMVYDEGRNAVTMFGGIPATRTAPWPSDTWAWQPEGWTRIATEGPSGRGRTALAYDKARRQVVLFGGVGAPAGDAQAQTFFSDTWVFASNRWRKVADTGPRGRYAHGMVFDERAGVVLLYSGSASHANAPLADMWQWDGTRWQEIVLTGPTPGFRYQPVMVYDRARGRTVLYGGLQGPATDTWEWDGRRWEEIRP